MAYCNHCGSEVAEKKRGAPRKYCGDLCKERARYARVGSRKKPDGYWKKRYCEDREYQKARALKYYYENRERILEQKRDNPGKADVVEEALFIIRSGRATEEDAYDWMDQGLGFHSCEIEYFIVEMLDEQ